MIQDLKPNSHKYRDAKEKGNLPEKRVSKVVSGKVKTKKKSEIGKMASVFISEDARNVKDYLVWDVAIPTLKKAILSALDMVLNGGNVSYSNRRDSGSKISYRDYWSEPRNSTRRSDSGQRNRFDYDEIVFESRGEAEAVLSEMEAVIDRYDFVTVADLYDMADLTPPAHTSNRYGWSNLRNAEVVRYRDRNGFGYVIKLPKALPMER